MSVVPPNLADHDTDPTGAPTAAVARRSGLGPFIVVLLYCAASAGALSYLYHHSDDYRVRAALVAGDAILGSDGGQGASIPKLKTAARDYLEALSIDPDEKWAQQQLQAVRWRFQERNVSFPRQLSLEAAAVGARATKPDDSSILAQIPVTPANRYPNALGAIERGIDYALAGLVVLLLWALWSFMNHRRAQARIRRAMAEHDVDSTAMY